MHEAPVDPLEPPKFRVKKVPRGPGSPPVPVMHSPPRAVGKEELEEWKIPPSVSNWKNPKGYIIPLDKRLAADGRGLQSMQINDKFAKFREALAVTGAEAPPPCLTCFRPAFFSFHVTPPRAHSSLRALVVARAAS